VSDPTKDNPKAPKRSSRRKPAMEPLGWDEIVSQPGMGGYLSFLNGPIPLPHLQPPAPEPLTDPVVVPDPAVVSKPEVVTGPAIESTPAIAPRMVTSGSVESYHPAIESTPAIALSPARPLTPSLEPAPVVVLSPAVVSSPDVATGPVVAAAAVIAPSPPRPRAPSAKPTPVVVSSPVVAPSPAVASAPALIPTTGRRPRIRKCAAAHDGHSLGEEVLYQALWKAATAESAGARIIVIGWRGMSQLCRMTPKNCKINTQRLIRKLALEVLSPYKTPESIGTTYRIFPSEAILGRRRAAGLEWVVRSRGVEFVDPATGIPLSAHLCGYVSGPA
jgi:hypothetical protein